MPNKKYSIGLGEPVFDKLHADLEKPCSASMPFMVFEYGSGFDGTGMKVPSTMIGS
jgi:chorismate synthase